MSLARVEEADDAALERHAKRLITADSLAAVFGGARERSKAELDVERPKRPTHDDRRAGLTGTRTAVTSWAAGR